MKKIIVLAGNRIEFERYLDEHGLTDSEALYGYSPEVLMGIKASGVIEVGTFYKHRNAYSLKREAEARIRPFPQEENYKKRYG